MAAMGGRILPPLPAAAATSLHFALFGMGISSLLWFVAVRHINGRTSPQPLGPREGIEAPLDAAPVETIALQNANDRLVARERFFQSLMSNSAEAIVVVAPEGTLEYANGAFTRLLDLRLDDWIGQSAFGLVWPEDLEMATQKLAAALQSPGCSLPWQLRLRHSDGRPRWFDGMVIHTPNDPHLSGLIVNGRDVTVQREMEGKLRTLSRALKQSPASVVITDPKGNIEYVNDKFSALTGYAYDDVRGRNPRLLSSGNTSKRAYQQMWATLNAGMEWRGEFINRKKSGELFWEYAAITPILDDEGAISHFLAVKEDLTERRNSQAALLASERRFHQVFANAPIGMALVALDGRFLRVNRALCSLVGFSEDELLKLSSHDLVGAHDDKVDRAYLNGLWDGVITDYEAEKRCSHKHGYDLWVQLNATLVRTSSGRPSCGILQIQNITARKESQTTLEHWASELEAANQQLVKERASREQIEAELRLAQKLEAVGQLAAGVAHEINTPMQYIGDSARYLANAFDGVREALVAYQAASERLSEIPGHEAVEAEVAQVVERTDLEFSLEEIPRALERVLDGTGRVTEIVRALKEFAHPDQREHTATDFNRMLATTLTVARNEYKHVADIETDFGELPLVACNVGEMNQVFLNLVVNAAHAVADTVSRTGERGRIALRSRRDGHDVVVEVEDSGGGIPTAIRERVFEPFFTTKPAGKGTGQGLAIAHSIVVDRHRGSLTFRTDEGRGTTFIIRVPVESHAEKEEAA